MHLNQDARRLRIVGYKSLDLYSDWRYGHALVFQKDHHPEQGRQLEVIAGILHFFFYYKQPIYKQLGLDLHKVKQLLAHVTISNFAIKIFAYENIATTLHNHISVYYTDVILFSDFIR